MTKKAQAPSTVDPFASARAEFEEMLAWISSKDCPEHHAEIEAGIDLRGREVHRLVLQGRLDQLFNAEADRLRRRPPRGKVRVRER